ncbi:hypothetical protein FDZ73_21070 [bacterium]|nr:MAG: hypothetical protein FDZ73_21070 [bacterium]
MSFSSNRRAVQDESLPLEHRASHARSCALHVANKLGVQREAVISEVAKKTGINLHGPVQAPELLQALAYLEALRHGDARLNA